MLAVVSDGDELVQLVFAEALAAQSCGAETKAHDYQPAEGNGQHRATY